tara:strand:- start:319 stop:699 length:381 start_codon:yes stop_codon:yes gene_type:complete
MKEQTNKANNLILGAIYINANTGQPCRLVNIVSCQGVWLEAYDGQGYGDLVQFNDCHYASQDEVQDFLDDYRVYNDVTSNKVNNGIESTLDEREYYHGKEIVRDYDGSAVIGWYDDDNGNDIRCRD